MSIGRFLAGVGALIKVDDKYLLLQRSAEKDFAAGMWECVTGRVDQGEAFDEAVLREVREELGVEARIEFIIGTTHFYRGEPVPEKELLGVVYACSISDSGEIRLSGEHTQFKWMHADEALRLLTDSDPTTSWIRQLIQRAERIREMLPQPLLDYYRQVGFSLD